MSNATDKKLEKMSKKEIRGGKETKKDVPTEIVRKIAEASSDEGTKIPKMINKSKISPAKSDFTNETLESCEKKITDPERKKKSNVNRGISNIPLENVPKKVAHRSKGFLSISKCLEEYEQDKKEDSRLKNYYGDEKDLSTTHCKSGVPNKSARSRIGWKGTETKEEGERNLRPKKKHLDSALHKANDDKIEKSSSDTTDKPQTEVTPPHPSPLTSCSFLEKLHQGVKAYFLPRSSLNADLDKNKKKDTEGGMQTGAGVAKGVTEELKKTKSKAVRYVTRNGKKIKFKFSKRARPSSERHRLNFQSSKWGGHSSIFFDNNLKIKRNFRVQKCKKLYSPKKHYVKIEIPRKGYFCRWLFQNKDAGTTMHSLHRMESNDFPRIETKIQFTRLASRSFKIPSIYKKRLTKSKKLKWSRLRKKSDQDLEDGCVLGKTPDKRHCKKAINPESRFRLNILRAKRKPVNYEMNNSLLVPKCSEQYVNHLETSNELEQLNNDCSEYFSDDCKLCIEKILKRITDLQNASGSGGGCSSHSYENSPRHPLSSKIRSAKFKTKSKRCKISFRPCVRYKSTVNPFSEVADNLFDILESSCEKNISSETFDEGQELNLNLQSEKSQDSVSVISETSTETLLHPVSSEFTLTEFPVDVDVDVELEKKLQDTECSSLELGTFFAEYFPKEFPTFNENFVQNTVYNLTKEPSCCCHLIQIETSSLPSIVSEYYSRPTLTDTYFENKLTSTIVGEIDLHLELENYFKAIYEPDALTNSKVYWNQSLQRSYDDNYVQNCGKYLSNETSLSFLESGTDVVFRNPTTDLFVLGDKITSSPSVLGSDSEFNQTHDTSVIEEFPEGKLNIEEKSKEFPLESSGTQISETLAKVSFETQSKEAKQIKSEPASKNQESASKSYIKRTCAKVSLMEDKELLGRSIPLQNEYNFSESGREKEGKCVSETYERVYPFRSVSLKKFKKKHNVLYENLVYRLSTESIRPATRKVLSETDIPPQNELLISQVFKDSNSFQKQCFKRNTICANSVPILCKNDLLSSPSEPKPEQSKLEKNIEKWCTSIQDLADIYNGKVPRSSRRLPKCDISDHILGIDKNLLREKMYKYSQMNSLKNVNDDVKIKGPLFTLPETWQSHLKKDALDKLQGCVKNFQEILISHLSISDIVHLNDTISGFQEKWAKNKNSFQEKKIVKSKKSSVEKLNQKGKGMKEVKCLGQAGEVSFVDSKSSRNWPSKARSWTNPSINKDLLGGSFKKSKCAEKKKKIETFSFLQLEPKNGKSSVQRKAEGKNETKPSSLSKTSASKTELSLSTPTESGSTLKSCNKKTDQGSGSVSDSQKSIHCNNGNHSSKKFLMTIKFQGDNILVSEIVQFKDEKALPKTQKKTEKETSQLIIERVAKDRITREPSVGEKNQKGKTKSVPLNNARNIKNDESPIKKAAVFTPTKKIRKTVNNCQPCLKEDVKKQEEKAKESGNDQNQEKTRSSSKKEFPENSILRIERHIEIAEHIERHREKYMEKMKKFSVDEKTNAKPSNTVKATERKFVKKSSCNEKLTKKSVSFAEKKEKCNVVKKDLNDSLKKQPKEKETQYEKLITSTANKVIRQPLRKITSKAKITILPFRPPSTFVKYPFIESNNRKSFKNVNKLTSDKCASNKVTPGKTVSLQKQTTSVKTPEVSAQFQDSSRSSTNEKQLNTLPPSSIFAIKEEMTAETKNGEKVSNELANATDQSKLHRTMLSLFKDATKNTSSDFEWKSRLFEVLTKAKLTMIRSKLDKSGSLDAYSLIEPQFSAICQYSCNRNYSLSLSLPLSMSDSILESSSSSARPTKSIFSDEHITYKRICRKSFAADPLTREEETVPLTQAGNPGTNGAPSDNSKTSKSDKFSENKMNDNIRLKSVEQFLKNWSAIKNVKCKEKEQSRNRNRGKSTVTSNVCYLYQRKFLTRHLQCLQSNNAKGEKVNREHRKKNQSTVINKNINSRIKKPEKSSTFPSDRTQNKKRIEKAMIKPESKNQARSADNNNKSCPPKMGGIKPTTEVKIDKVQVHTEGQKDEKSENPKRTYYKADAGKIRKKVNSGSEIDQKSMNLLFELLKIVRDSILEVRGFKNKTRVVDIIDKYLNVVNSRALATPDLEEKLLKVISLESKKVKLNDGKMSTFSLYNSKSSLVLPKEIIGSWKSLKSFRIKIHSSSKSKKETEEQTQQQQQQQQQCGGLVTEQNYSECQKDSLVIAEHQSKLNEIKILEPIETDSKVEENEKELSKTPSTYFDAENTQTESSKQDHENPSCSEIDEAVSSTVTEDEGTTEPCEEGTKSSVSLLSLDLFPLHDHQQKECFDETLFNEIMNNLKYKNYYYSILLLEGWLKKIEKQSDAKNQVRNCKLRKLIESLHDTSNNLLASLEKKGWTKMLYLVEEICNQCEKLWNGGKVTTQLAETNPNQRAKFSRNMAMLLNIEDKIIELLTYIKKHVNVTSLYKNKIENNSYEKVLNIESAENWASYLLEGLSSYTNLGKGGNTIKENNRLIHGKLPRIGEILDRIGDSYNLLKRGLSRIWGQLSFLNMENDENGNDLIYTGTPINPEAFRLSDGQPDVKYHKSILLVLRKKIRKQRLDIQYRINIEPANLEIQSLKNSVAENMLIIEKYISLLVK